MQLGGRAWRGYFPVGGELTSGRPDLKEGIYFGAEYPATPETPVGDDVWGVGVGPIETVPAVADNRSERWDGASVHAFRGTYGDYILAKVSNVFPALRPTCCSHNAGELHARLIGVHTGRR
jgi:hypothetical protein